MSVLVVLRSCADCAHYDRRALERCVHCDREQPERCAHPDAAMRDLPGEDVIPEWCPMREKEPTR